MSGGTTRKFLNASWPHRRNESVLVARKFQLGVQLNASERPKVVDLHGVIDDELNGLSGLTDPGCRQTNHAVRIAARSQRRKHR